jgi:hypothetical protein
MIIRAAKLPKTSLTYEGDNFNVTHADVIDDVLLLNKEDRKDPYNGFSRDRNYRRVASIPVLTWMEWAKTHPELACGDRELRDKTLKKLLRSAENAVFKTVGGGV